MTKQEIQAMMAENAALKAAANRKTAPAIRLKVSEKGGISVYGLGRFPVTLYKSQMKRFLGAKAEIEGFMELHSGELAEKAAPIAKAS